MNAKTPSVLLVEDEALVSDMITEVLTEEGFEVRAATNAREALNHLADGFNADVLFTDINLPNGFDGAALAMRARELRPDLRVVYASGRCGPGQFVSVPGSVFIPKPYSPFDLCSLLTRLARAA
jgi:CheY-like chemotaxis protein